MAELTPRDDNRKRVSEILKRVDQLIKSQEYEQAQRETERAKEIDPRNVYISAYQERLVALIEQAKKDREQAEIRKKEEEETRKRLEEERKKEEAIRQQKLAEERARQEEEQRKKKIEEEDLRKKIEEEQKKKIEEDVLKKRTEEDGRSKKEEEEIRRRLDEARRKTSSGSGSKHHSEVDGAKVFIIDDDEKLLNILKSTLAEEGYSVFAFSTSDDAYQELKNETPDLILSDINLETSTMGGFSFYEKVRELDHLHEVPFVFLSGLSDEVLVRTGKELGVDDYVTKPFSEKHLLAVVKGKIKRYQQLKERRK